MQSLKELALSTLAKQIVSSPPLISELISDKTVAEIKCESQRTLKVQIENDLPYIINDIMQQRQCFRSTYSIMSVSHTYFLNKYSNVDPSIVLAAITAADLIALNTNTTHINSNTDANMSDDGSEDDEVDYSDEESDENSSIY